MSTLLKVAQMSGGTVALMSGGTYDSGTKVAASPCVPLWIELINREMECKSFHYNLNSSKITAY